MNQHRTMLRWLFIAAIFGIAASEKTANSVQTEIFKRIFEKYDALAFRARPPPYDRGTIVKLQLNILRIEMEDEGMSVDMDLRQEWRDKRLAWNSEPKFRSYKGDIIYRGPIKFWTSDLFFRNEKNGFQHSMTQPNSVLRLKSDGTARWDQKISMKFLCRSEDRNLFPMDSARCIIDIGSYSYRSSVMKFEWSTLGHAKNISSIPVVGEFDLQSIDRIDCTMQYATSSGSYSCLHMKFYFGLRSSSGYITSVYLPTTFALFMAWLAFWIEREALLSRILLLVIPFASVASSAASNSWPVKNALHEWQAFCMCLLAFQLLVIVGPKLIERFCQSRGKDEEKEDRPRANRSTAALAILEMFLGRIVVPIIFVLFNIGYWIKYKR